LVNYKDHHFKFFRIDTVISLQTGRPK